MSTSDRQKMEKKAGEETISVENQPIIEKKEEINPSQQKLIDEVDALRRELTKMKKENEKRAKNDEVKKAEQKEDRKETENETRMTTAAQKEVEKRSQNIEDEVILDIEYEELLFNSPPKGAEVEAKSFWESTLNKSKSRTEFERMQHTKKGEKPTDAARLIKNEIRSAESDIKEKEADSIPPEGKKRKWQTVKSELDIPKYEMEERNRLMFLGRTPPTFPTALGNSPGEERKLFLKSEHEQNPNEVKEIIDRLLNVREKASQAADEAQLAMRSIEKLFGLKEKREKRGAIHGENYLRNANESFGYSWFGHDSRWKTRGGLRGRGQWRGNGAGRGGRGNWRDQIDEWGPGTSQSAEDYSKMAGWA
uniref:Uncharacterized protein n=1 Tax=Globodera rostochiensis TaxID=31243 RepID=A0A914HLZ7_GLORO